MVYFPSSITRSDGQIFVFAESQNIHQLATRINLDPASPANSIPRSRDNGPRFTAANLI